MPRLLRLALLKLLQPLPQVKRSLPAAAANAFVFLTAIVMKHGHCRACFGPLARDLQQAAGSIVAGETAASSCNDSLPHITELRGALTLSNSEPHFCRKGKVQRDPQGKRKKNNFLRKRVSACEFFGWDCLKCCAM